MYDRVQDMPDIIRAGLPVDVQNMVRGVVNYFVYDERLNAGQAVSKAQKTLENAGYKWTGTRWESLVKKGEISGVITKTFADNRLVFGWANVIKTSDGKVIVDREADFIDDSWEIEKAAYDYVLHSRDGSDSHALRGTATCVESMVFTEEKIEKMGIPQGLLPIGWWIGFKVHDDLVWKNVTDDEYTGFSVHGAGMRKATILDPDVHTREGA